LRRQTLAEKNAARYAPLKATLLATTSTLTNRFADRTLLHDFQLSLVCKPDSHTTLLQFVNLLQRRSLAWSKPASK